MISHRDVIVFLLDICILSAGTSSDVPAPAWPESPGFGLALGGSGFVKSQARPKAENLAWPGLALA
jgi:hypothetical protein